jgi:hypothetical protein
MKGPFVLLVISITTASLLAANKYRCGCMFATNCVPNFPSCCPGLHCVGTDGNTQCLESTVYTSKVGCVVTNQNGCNKNSDCCNPFAVCSNYKNCILNYTCNYYYTPPDPSNQPTRLPTLQPFRKPSCQPIRKPISKPSTQPRGRPTQQPRGKPASHPTSLPSISPTKTPSHQPVHHPTLQPYRHPSTMPTRQPKNKPSIQPSKLPTKQPICFPSNAPSNQPYESPTTRPSTQPISHPSHQPFQKPSSSPSKQPRRFPSCQPLLRPTNIPSRSPSSKPSFQPLRKPTFVPSHQPQSTPSLVPSYQPTSSPSRSPWLLPIALPSRQPREHPSSLPSTQPVFGPTFQPISYPSDRPTSQPNGNPSADPSTRPNVSPTFQPFTYPSGLPTSQPLRVPSTEPTNQPYNYPSNSPTSMPLVHIPSLQPSAIPSQQPFLIPTSSPSMLPSFVPSNVPTGEPSFLPSSQPKINPSTQPTERPINTPSNVPSKIPTTRPSIHPLIQPSSDPTSQPSKSPSLAPDTSPTQLPSSRPSIQPFQKPVNSPTSLPTSQPSSIPMIQPSKSPLEEPSCTPSGQPVIQPSMKPMTNPSSAPSIRTQSPSYTVTVFSSVNPTFYPTASVYFYTFNRSVSTGSAEFIAFETLFLLVNLSSQTLDAGHRNAFVKTVAGIMNISTSAVQLSSPFSTRRNLLDTFQHQQLTTTTLMISQFPKYSGNLAGLVGSLLMLLEMAVYSGFATAQFRSFLASLDVVDNSLPAIVAVTNTKAQLTPAPSSQPIQTGSSNANHSSSSSSSLSLTVGLVAGVFSLLCIAVPLLYLVKKKMAVKQKSEKPSLEESSSKSTSHGSGDTLGFEQTDVLVQRNARKRPIDNDTLSFSDFHYLYKSADGPELGTASFDHASQSTRRSNAISKEAKDAIVAPGLKSQPGSPLQRVMEFFKVRKDQMAGAHAASHNSDIAQSRDQKDDKDGQVKGFVQGFFHTTSHFPIENPTDNVVYSKSNGSLFGSMGFDKFYSAHENDLLNNHAVEVFHTEPELKSKPGISLQRVLDFFKVEKDQIAGANIISTNSDIVLSKDQKDLRGTKRNNGKSFVEGAFFHSTSHLPIENPADDAVLSKSAGSMFGSMGLDKFYSAHENDDICDSKVAAAAADITTTPADVKSPNGMSFRRLREQGRSIVEGAFFHSTSHFQIENPTENALKSTSDGSLFGSMGLDKIYSYHEHDNICMPEAVAQFSLKKTQTTTTLGSPHKRDQNAPPLVENAAAPVAVAEEGAPKTLKSEDDAHQGESVEGVTSKSKDSLDSDGLTFVVG